MAQLQETEKNLNQKEHFFKLPSAFDKTTLI